jgi:hypothetical protein
MAKLLAMELKQVEMRCDQGRSGECTDNQLLTTYFSGMSTQKREPLFGNDEGWLTRGALNDAVIVDVKHFAGDIVVRDSGDLEDVDGWRSTVLNEKFVDEWRLGTRIQ